MISSEVLKKEESKHSNIFKHIKRISIAILIMLCLVVVAIIAWENTSYSCMQTANKALQSDNKVIVNDGEYISFTPKDTTPQKGFIFYPGAKVEAESYAPLCREIAQAGYEVVIAKMPLNFAILGQNEANKIINDYNNINSWAIGGHSLGGVAASKFASENDKIKGVALYASYPSGDELLNSNKEVISIWGSKDNVLNMDSLKESVNNLPKDTKFIEIEGGNHDQFGDYGAQKGDNKASISEKEQTDIAAKNTIELLESIN